MVSNLSSTNMLILFLFICTRKVKGVFSKSFDSFGLRSNSYISFFEKSCYNLLHVVQIVGTFNFLVRIVVTIRIIDGDGLV